MAAPGPLAAEVLIGGLLRASIEGAVVIALVALLVRAVPAIPPRLRCGLWWAACLKLVVGLAIVLAGGRGLELALLPGSVTSVPGLAGSQAGPALPAGRNSFSEGKAEEVGGAAGAKPRPTAAPDREPASVARPGSSASLPSLPAAAPAATARPAASAPASSAPGWLRPALLPLNGLWLFGLLLMTAAALLQRARLARRLRAAAPVDDPAVLDLLAATAARFGVAAPPLRAMAADASPQLVGTFRPRLLVPRRALAPGRRGDLELILAHELAHLRRRDLVLGWVPALARGLFFFHPLAAHAVREYVLAREAACDAEVLRVLDAAPRDYGRMLLDWGVALDGSRTLAGGPLAATLGRHRHLKRRLLMLETTTKTRGRLRPALALLAALPVLAALAPVRLVAAPDAERAAGLDTPPPAASPAAAPRVAFQVAALDAQEPAARRDAAAKDEAAKDKAGKKGSTHSYVWSDDDGEPMFYVSGDGSVGWLGDQTGRVRALRRGDEPLLWFVRDGREYVVRDAATLARVEEIYAPVTELGRRQGELGGRQGELGGRQGDLGGEQGELGAEQGKLGARQARLAAEIATAAAKRMTLELEDEPDASALADLERRERELNAEMQELADRQRALGERQRALGEKQRELGEQQRALGEQQQELGEQQRAASAKAREALDTLIDQAIAAGTAEPLD